MELKVSIHLMCPIDSLTDGSRDFTFFPTAFQLSQDNRKVIMKGCVHWDPIYD